MRLQRRVRPHRAVADFDREADHLVAQRCQHDRRQPAHLLGRGAHRADVLAHVAERLAGLHAEPLDDRPVGDADAEAEAAAGDLVQVRRRGGECDRVLQVDRLDGGAELDGGGDVRDREAQAHRVAEAGAVDAREPTPLDLLRQLQRLGPPPRSSSK